MAVYWLTLNSGLSSLVALAYCLHQQNKQNNNAYPVTIPQLTFYRSTSITSVHTNLWCCGNHFSLCDGIFFTDTRQEVSSSTRAYVTSQSAPYGDMYTFRRLCNAAAHAIRPCLHILGAEFVESWMGMFECLASTICSHCFMKHFDRREGRSRIVRIKGQRNGTL